MATNVSSTDDYLKNSVISLQELKNDAKSQLLAILQSLRGRKCLVLDDQLAGIFNLIMNSNSGADTGKESESNGVKYLREFGVTDIKKLHSGQASIASTNADHIVYVTRAELSNMRTISGQILHAINTSANRFQFHIYYIPFHTIICEQILEDEHVIGHVTSVGEFGIGLIPLDRDVLSLEMPDMFRQCYVDGDTSSLNIIAQSLHKLQTLYGVIPNIKLKGSASRKIVQKLLQLRKQAHENTIGTMQATSAGKDGADLLNLSTGATVVTPQIDTLVILDREVDLISPLVTPLTYEGLLDELIGFDYGKIIVDARIQGDISDPPKLPNLPPGMEQAAAATADTNRPVYNPDDKVTLLLNAADPIYNDIRDTSIEKLGAYMQEKAISIRRTYNAFRENKDASLQEIADFVKKIPGITREYKLLHQHINLAEMVKRTTDSREFRDYWQIERGILEGDSESTALDYIEDLIAADISRVELYHVLRLLCLLSMCGGGIKRNYDGVKRSIVHTYGYSQVFTLYNLERVGLLKRGTKASVGLGLGLDSGSNSNTAWTALKRQFNLIVDGSLLDSQADISYVTAGYAPMSVRLVQAAVRSGGWGTNVRNARNGFTDVMKLLPGPTIEFTQHSHIIDNSVADAVTREQAGSKTTVGDQNEPIVAPRGAVGAHGKKVMMVYVVGGLTFMEIAALRTLSQHRDFPYTIIMATTKLISANSLLTSLMSVEQR